MIRSFYRLNNENNAGNGFRKEAAIPFESRKINEVAEQTTKTELIHQEIKTIKNSLDT